MELFKKDPKEGQLKKDLSGFLAEIEKNLEFFYVMDQRRFITHGFLMDRWSRVNGMELIKRHETIARYARAMEEFNNSFKAHQEYEDWYAGDIKNRTPENARKLHDLKHELDGKLNGMEAVIILAGQDLEREMSQLGLLKA